MFTEHRFAADTSLGTKDSAVKRKDDNYSTLDET